MPILTASDRNEVLFEQNPLKLVLRASPVWIAALLTTWVYGYFASRFRTIREPMFVGFLLLTSGAVGFATIQPGQSINALCFTGLTGIGFGGPLALVFAGVQLTTPPDLIATATAVTTSARAVASTIFTAIFTATVNTRLGRNIPDYVGKAAIDAGLPTKSVKAFIDALTNYDDAALSKVSGVTPDIISVGAAALKQAYADSIRLVFIIGSAFGALACVLCFFLGDVRETMNNRVDAPVEDLHAGSDRRPSDNAA